MKFGAVGDPLQCVHVQSVRLYGQIFASKQGEQNRSTRRIIPLCLGAAGCKAGDAGAGGGAEGLGPTCSVYQMLKIPSISTDQR